jgi:hypothetical protein
MFLFTMSAAIAMKRAACVLFLIGIGAQSSHARTIGPDAFGYFATDEIAPAFEDIASSGKRVLAGVDDGSTTASPGFAFEFYGVAYDSVSWTPNGLITFGGANSQLTNVDLTSAAPTGNFASIAVLWDDWTFAPGGSDASYYETRGAPGDRRFIVQWNDVRHFDFGPGPVTFQAVLFERDDSVQLNFLDLIADNSRADYGADATVGIRDVSGQIDGRALQWSFNEPAVPSNTSIHFAALPEPGSLALFSAGLAGVLKRPRRRW